MTHPPIVSVIVPAYNSEGNIAKTIESLQQQTLGDDKLEIILVNDGSKDNTSAICHEYADKASNIVAIDKENGGVSSARNVGIEAARGTYIAFLDSDDTLLPETLEAATDFFAAHHDEIDVVSYPMRLHDDKKEWSHVREEVMTETGVYDLAKPQNVYALITNMNAIVKNDESLPRFREDLAVHEDEQFFMSVLLDKQKVGFCKKGAYRYQQLADSVANTKMHPFYQFEENIGFWEDLFAAYPEKAPLYLQASFLNEMNWKIKRDIVFPYHYDEPRFETAVGRIRALMNRIDDDVIFTSPRAEEYLQHYFFSLKTNTQPRFSLDENGFALHDGKELLLCRNHIELEFILTRVSNGFFCMKGVLKSVAFDYVGSPRLFMRVGGADRQAVLLAPSSRSRSQARVVTSTYWGFDAQADIGSNSSISFELLVGNVEVPLHLSFSARAQLNTANGISAFSSEDALISVDQGNQGFAIKHGASYFSRQAHWMRNTLNVRQDNPKASLIRVASKVRKKRKAPLWLYYDRPGVKGDNAYYQFLHDFEQQDGVERFYVTKDGKRALEGMFESKHEAHVIRFSSFEHRFLHLQADRIVASYAELSTWCPYSGKTMRGLADVLRYDMVYLQHGVLHAHMPWKYSADRLLMDYEVVSTGFEHDNLVQRYGFQPSQLIESGMPRYDRIPSDAPGSRAILFAPSWRKNLVAEGSSASFSSSSELLFNSSFWRETSAFLSDACLFETLEEFDYRLDVKLHPNFKGYASEFKRFQNDRIRIVDDVNESDYRIFITDYSSWVFDFVYLKRAIAYFLPDEQEFKSGLHGYHKLDLPLEDGFGPLAHTGSELVDVLRSLIERGGVADPVYRKRMEGFFLHYDDSQCERLYKAMMAISGRGESSEHGACHVQPPCSC